MDDKIGFAGEIGGMNYYVGPEMSDGIRFSNVEPSASIAPVKPVDMSTDSREIKSPKKGL